MFNTIEEILGNCDSKDVINLKERFADIENNFTSNNFNNILDAINNILGLDKSIIPHKTFMTKWPRFVKSERSPFIWENPNLQSEYSNVTETYFACLYISILRKYLHNSMFNYRIVDIVNFVYELRKYYKFNVYREYKYRSIQLGCKVFMNALYSQVNFGKSNLHCCIDYQTAVCDIAKSIMSTIFLKIQKDGLIDDIIYMDTDCVVSKCTNISSYFKMAAKDLTFHTESYKIIEFAGNFKKRNKIR